MFSNLFNLANSSDATPMFAGLPLVNPLLNDATTNIETLNERIAQLESVSQWLNMNLQMVNASVQQLQVQKQTLQALAEWQKLSKGAMEEFTKTKVDEPASTSKSKKTAAKPDEPTTPAAFEQMAQSWWDGLQQQFAQLAQPLVEPEVKAEPVKKPATRARKPKTV